MTESGWLASDDPRAMLEALRTHTARRADGGRVRSAGEPSDRKLRLFACACCRQAWHLLTDERSRRAVEFGEELAERLGLLTVERLHEEEPPGGERDLVSAAACRAGADARTNESAHAADAAWALVGTMRADEAARQVLRELSPYNAMPADPAAQAAILRDLVGNPWRPVARWQPHEHLLSRDWWLSQIESLATAAYEHRSADGTLDPVRLAVLADALEEAGCTDESILMHLRGLEWYQVDPDYYPEEVVKRRLDNPAHYRGCWVVDLILGRE